MKEKDEHHEIQGEIETSILNKKKTSTDEKQGGSEASNDSIPLKELRKILYQKGKLQKIKGKNKTQRPNISTKLPSKKLEQNEETSSVSVPIAELFRVNTEKNKHYSKIQAETETRIPWTAVQKSRAQQLASKVQAGNPYFQKVLKKYNLTFPYRMCILRKFSANHLNRDKLDIIIYCPDQGKTWFVTSYFGSLRNEQMFRGPTWEKFVKENKLQQDDLCLFELVKTAKRLTFVVHISRATNILDS